MWSDYGGWALATIILNAGGAGDAVCAAVCVESDNDGYIIQGAYTFNGTTKLGIAYGESNEKASGAAKSTNSLWTVGV